MKRSWLVPVMGVFFFGGATVAFADTCCSFVYSNGTFGPVNYSGGGFTFAEGINNSGQIVGYYYNGTATHLLGFLDNGGRIRLRSLRKQLHFVRISRQR